MATRTIANGGGNYNSTGTWVEGAVPTSADDVVATGTSGALTVTAAAAAKTLVLTGYTSTLTINSGQTLTVSGDVNLASGMTYAGAGSLAIAATATLTANGKTVSGDLLLNNGTFTITLADNWIVTGLFNVVTGGSTVTFNGNQITLNGSVTLAARLAGTTAIVIAGTGTWTGTTTNSRYCSCPITINTAGTLTIAAAGPCLGGGTLTYTAGTFAGTGTWLIGASQTISGALPTIYNLTVNGLSVTLTLNNTLTVSNIFSTTKVSSATTLTITGANLTVGTLELHVMYSLIFDSTRTLTVSTTLQAIGSSLEATQTIRAATATSAFTLTYNGTQAAMRLSYVIFTDVTATNPLWNHWGGTLTRTSGITNISYTPGDYSDPGESHVQSGTSYLYQGATKNGSYAGGGGGLLTHPGMSGGMRG